MYKELLKANELQNPLTFMTFYLKNDLPFYVK